MYGYTSRFLFFLLVFFFFFFLLLLLCHCYTRAQFLCLSGQTSVPGVCNYGYILLSYLGNIVMMTETTMTSCFLPWMVEPYNPTAFRKAKIVCNFGLSECNRVNKTCHRDRIARLTAPCPSHKKL